MAPLIVVLSNLTAGQMARALVVAAFAGIGLSLAYPITRQKHARIARALEQRRNASC